MTPQLRFPEFTDEWQVKKLGDVVDFRNGKAHEKSVTENGKFTIVNSKFISTSGKVRKYSDSQIEPLFSDEIVMVMSDIPNGKALAKCYYIEKSETYTLNQRICALSERSPNSNQFLIYTVNRNKYYLEFDNGVSQTNLRKDEVLACPLHIPSGTEQEKIADFLTAVDERIAVSEKKLELLETYKRGAMQKIFSQQIRFKDENGNPYPDWEEKKLGEVFNCLKGTGLSREQITDTGLNKCILYGELYTKYGEVIENVISRTNSNAGISSKSNDLLLPCSTTTTGIDLANATALNEADVQLGGDISILRFKKSGSNIFYAYYLSHFMKQKLASYGQGSTIVHMYFSHFKNMIVVEPSIEEQQKIATFLTTLDEKITAEKSKLTAAKQFKKALLQRMFV